jgi:glycosyltransferase involved in cell wall biosynthesis
MRNRALFLAPYLGDGGINTHMLTLGTELQRLGWQVAICSGGPHADPAHVGTSGRRSGSPVPEDYERAGISHIGVRVPASPHGLRELWQLLLVPLALWQVLRAVRRFRPAIVHSHSRQMGLYAQVARVLLRVPFISSVHSPVVPRSRWWAKTTFLGARVIAVSEQIESGLVYDYRVPAERIRVIPPAADPDHFRPPSLEERRDARARWGIPPDQFAISFVGSLTANKNPETIVQAIADLRRSGHDVVALLAGRGPAEEPASARAEQLGIADRIRFLGYQDARSVLWAADAFVLPSRSEGSPLVIVEAMLSGAVVVATQAGGAAQQLTPGVTGMAFRYGDHQDLANRIQQLIAEPWLRENLARRALDDARERFSSTAMARRVLATYEEALQEVASRGGRARPPIE